MSVKKLWSLQMRHDVQLCECVEYFSEVHRSSDLPKLLECM